MRRMISILCTLGQLALTGPAVAQSVGFGLGVSNGPVTLSIGTGNRNTLTCVTRIVPTGGEVRLRRGMVVESVSCTDTSCTEQQVVICPTRR